MLILNIFYSKLQRERDAREARQLDREIRAQERHYQAETKKHKDAADKASAQVGQAHRGSPNERSSSTSTPPTRSPRDSVERSSLLTQVPSSSDPFLQLVSPSGPSTTQEAVNYNLNHICQVSHNTNSFKLQENLSTLTSPKSNTTETTPSPSSHYHRLDHNQQRLHQIRRRNSPPSSTESPVSTVAGSTPISFAVSALTTVAPSVPHGAATLRDDSTESEQSLTCSQSQSEALHRYMWVDLVIN